MSTTDLTAEFDRLEQTYEQIEKCVKHIAAGSVRSLVVNGPPGVGKSHMIKSFLDTYKTKGHMVVTGHMTLLSLYHALYAHREQGQVLVLDDVDSVFKKLEGLNLLKAAMDTQTQRNINWESSSSMLSALQVPNRFQFNGGVILISNVGFDRDTSKLAAHLKALSDRSYIIKLTDGGRTSAFVQVAFMTMCRGLLDAYNFTATEVEALLNFMQEHLERLNTVSLRTMMKLADLYRLEPTTWHHTATVTLMGAK